MMNYKLIKNLRSASVSAARRKRLLFWVVAVAWQYKVDLIHRSRSIAFIDPIRSPWYHPPQHLFGNLIRHFLILFFALGCNVGLLGWLFIKRVSSWISLISMYVKHYKGFQDRSIFNPTRDSPSWNAGPPWVLFSGATLERPVEWWIIIWARACMHACLTPSKIVGPSWLLQRRPGAGTWWTIYLGGEVLKNMTGQLALVHPTLLHHPDKY